MHVYIKGMFNFKLSHWQVNDNNVLEKPFGNFKVGQTITARIVGKPNQKGHLWDLSIKPAMLAGKTISWKLLLNACESTFKP